MANSDIRQAAVAGRFYPRDPIELRRLVSGFLAEVRAPGGPVPKALIAPHAGYIYSGPIAASAYAQFIPARDTIKRVVILGPAHYVPFAGFATCSASAFATPLGLVPVDVEAVQRLNRLPQVAPLDAAHANEHALEVQLPFLQVVLKEFAIVPILAGEAIAEQAGEVLDVFWDAPDTRFVISSDLSHRFDSDTARRCDGATAEAIEALAPELLASHQACGCIPIQGLLASARRHGLHARTLDLRNSGDTAGPRDEVVGYGAFAFATA